MLPATNPGMTHSPEQPHIEVSRLTITKWLDQDGEVGFTVRSSEHETSEALGMMETGKHMLWDDDHHSG